jgi:hypothetical protein
MRQVGNGHRLVLKSEGRDHLNDPAVDGRIILKWIL